MLTCSRCADTYYCGVACQRKHWPVHKEGCRAPLSAADFAPILEGYFQAHGERLAAQWAHDAETGHCLPGRLRAPVISAWRRDSATLFVRYDVEDPAATMATLHDGDALYNYYVGTVLEAVVHEGARVAGPAAVLETSRWRFVRQHSTPLSMAFSFEFAPQCEDT